MTHTTPPTITVRVSAPYVHIAGGWTGMRPVGQRRDYRATVYGTDLHLTNKAEITRKIRQLVYRATGSTRVTIEFHTTPEGN